MPARVSNQLITKARLPATDHDDGSSAPLHVVTTIFDRLPVRPGQRLLAIPWA
jgi:hypothetical protein